MASPWKGDGPEPGVKPLDRTLVFQADEQRGGQEARSAELELALGRLTLEHEVLKKVSTRLD
ncbi:MAG TPA: hypothetical protein VFF52_07125 [Isosphaeraceae bacterium]|nr:hypothetical protein [Isosphaeraceae bacterium]